MQEGGFGPRLARLRHRVQPAGLKGMTTGYATQREPEAAQRAVPSKGFLGIDRAARLEATDVTEERRDKKPIAPQEDPS